MSRRRRSFHLLDLWDDRNHWTLFFSFPHPPGVCVVCLSKSFLQNEKSDIHGYSCAWKRRVYLHCTLQKPRRNIVLVIQSCADGRRDWNLSISTLFKMTQHQFYYFPTNCRQNILSLPNRKIIVLHPKRTENWYMPTTMISENPDEMTISWVTKDDTGHSLVEYGPQTLHLVAKGSSTLFVDGGAERRTMYMHRVTLKKLSAGQIYSKSRVIW